MKILFLSEFFHPHWTGYAKSLFKAALRLQEKGYQCAVLSTKHDENLPDFEEYQGISIFRTRPLITISRTNYSIRSIFKFIGLVKDYDIIFINAPDSNMLWFSLIAKLFHKKTIVFLHADLILPPGLVNRILEKIFDISIYISCSLADVITTHVEDYAIHCRSYKRHLDKFMPLLLPAGLVDRRIDQELDEKIKKIRLAHGASALVGFAGRFVEQKAFDILLKAIPQVVRQYPGVHFLFAGQAPAYEDFFERHKALWEACAPFITDLGLLKGEAKMNAYYHNLDLFVLSSRVEPFGIVQTEAIEHGVPLVVTDVPGARWIVKESGFGVLAPPEDPDSLAAAIVTALKRGKSGFPGWEKAKEITDTENFFRQFAAIEGRLFPDARPQG